MIYYQAYGTLIVIPLPGTLHSAMSSSSPMRNPSLESSVAVGVAITAVAGVAVAAAVGGTLIYSRRSPFRRRKKRKSPLSEKQWRDAFDPESGRLIDQHKVLKKIRHGGIDRSIRAEVWLFLLGFYDLDSTQEEREAEECRKRDVYRDLRTQCDTLRGNVSEDVADLNGVDKTIDTELGASSSFGLEEQQMFAKNADSEMDSSEEASEKEHRAEVATTTATPASTAMENQNIKDGCLKDTEDFITWQRIMRLDAVRMNAEWVPYSPSQANVSEEVAGELATSVGLKDDEHLEPCRQHHAARLVGILEAYALFDPETGYCQGMSDLLSPFVALLDEDYQAFWCFVQFMNTARHNFRLDEAGIRRQLNKISSIFKVGDPHLYSHLESMDAQDCYFVYRMVVVLLRRELTFEQTISLWEVIWAEKRAAGISHVRTLSWRKSRKRSYVTDDLILFVIAAAVRQKRKLIEKCKGMDEILRECNSMAGHLDVWSLLDDARELVSAVQGRIPE
ncbi:hypothetical protein GOP47_0015333 [Adiantum capillus-veneris]|uniref:Rab-GAP TBC domain-containing protein n=1 Tax=Adiantum capillus-veneris TaxID=13818 RepID=A0A9D4UJU1_ADICA|nr:hypothetical protein GOP47_0015333 [Adiantum capillus-veneris]